MNQYLIDTKFAAQSLIEIIHHEENELSVLDKQFEGHCPTIVADTPSVFRKIPHHLVSNNFPPKGYFRSTPSHFIGELTHHFTYPVHLFGVLTDLFAKLVRLGGERTHLLPTQFTFLVNWLASDVGRRNQRN